MRLFAQTLNFRLSTRTLTVVSDTTATPARTARTVPNLSDGPVELVITLDQVDQAVLLAAIGDIDIHSAPYLNSALRQAAAARLPLTVLDLSAVEFLSCAGLSVLVAAHKGAGRHSCLRVVSNTRATRRLLELTGLDGYLAVHHSRDEALYTPVIFEPVGPRGPGR